MNAFRQFSMTINKIIKNCSTDLKNAAIQMEKQMVGKEKYQQEFTNEEDTTLSLVLQLVKSGVDQLAQDLEEATHQILGDLIEPLETFTRLYL